MDRRGVAARRFHGCDGALAEAVTRLRDRADAVPDEIWEEAARHYDEPALAALVVSIARINVRNRLDAAVRQVAGAHRS